jgi:hypothetical protein
MIERISAFGRSGDLVDPAFKDKTRPKSKNNIKVLFISRLLAMLVTGLSVIPIAD